MSDASFWEVAPTVVTAGAAVAAVWYARSGLNTWRQQLKGTAHFELARELLVKSYELRDGITAVRNTPAIENLATEQDVADNDLDLKGVLELSFKKGLLQRMQTCINSLRQMDSLILQAEALWDSSTRQKFEDLKGLLIELNSSMQTYFKKTDPTVPGLVREIQYEWLNDPDFEKTLIDHSTPSEPDDFQKRLSAAVDSIEQDLRPHLKRDRGIL